MSTGQLAPVITYLRKAASPLGDADDADLLSRFARHGDDEAFAALVERHGAMVLGVCRRVLGDAHEAEDAFQATFLLLLRKAGSLRPGPLGPWLHGVAYRTALKARSRSVLRRARGVGENDRIAADPTEEVAWRDLRPLLDEAIGRLPHSYRVPFVLCYLEGRTNAEAAEELGCPRGTVATRLSRARERLRSHLTRRGLTLSAGLLSALLSREAAAREVVSARLSESAARSACGPGAGNVPVPATVLALTKGVARTMLMERLKVVLALLLVAGAGTSLLVLSRRADARTPGEVRESTIPAPPPRQEEPPDRPGSHRTKNFHVHAPSSRVARLVGEAAEHHREQQARLWLGKELPPWSEPCPIQVTITARGSGGATSFAFDAGKVLNQNMHLEGPLDSLLANVLPHEVTHTVLAHAVGKPLPRWADEGAAVLAEDEQEHKRHERLMGRILDERRAMPLRRLFALNEYPRDVMTLFAQGYSVTAFLVAKSDRPTFLAFVKQGMRDDWDRAARTHYDFRNVEALEDAWLAKLRRTAPRKDDPATLATSTNEPGDARAVEGRSRLPASPPPLLLLARCQEGILTVRTSVPSYQLRETKVPGKDRDRIAYVYEPAQTERTTYVEGSAVRAFGTDGKAIDGKKLARLLAKETPVLVSADGKPVAPFYLRVVKEGTLVLILQTKQFPATPSAPVVAEPPPPAQGPALPAPVVPIAPTVPPLSPAELPPPTPRP